MSPCSLGPRFHQCWRSCPWCSNKASTRSQHASGWKLTMHANPPRRVLGIGPFTDMPQLCFQLIWQKSLPAARLTSRSFSSCHRSKDTALLTKAFKMNASLGRTSSMSSTYAVIDSLALLVTVWRPCWSTQMAQALAAITALVSTCEETLC